MSGFDDGWLALREPVDARSRNPELQARLCDVLAARSSIRVIDLGAGTGSNFRHLAPLLCASQHWQLVDNDNRLLQHQSVRLAEWSLRRGAVMQQNSAGIDIKASDLEATVERRHADLVTGMSTLGIEHADLLTGSALLDLAGREWLAALAGHCAGSGCVAFFTLSYDGRIDWTPGHANDADVRSRVNAHQRQDKGLGVAAGPDATAILVECFGQHDFDIHTGTSDWHLGVDSSALQQEYDRGLARAAGEFDPGFADIASGWLADRKSSSDADPTSSTMVGHRDVLAIPRSLKPR